MMKTIFYPFIPAMVNHVEKWLAQQSRKGLALTYMNGWRFVFSEKKDGNAEYFFYSGFDLSKGLSYDYYQAKDKYGKKQSVLNKNTCSVFEIDPDKKDNDFLIYHRLRNNYYIKHYFKLLLFSFGFCMVSLWLSIYLFLFWFVFSAFAVTVLYSGISLLVLRSSE